MAAIFQTVGIEGIRQLVVFVSGTRMRLIDSTQKIRFSFAREETNEITTSVLWRDVVCVVQKKLASGRKIRCFGKSFSMHK